MAPFDGAFSVEGLEDFEGLRDSGYSGFEIRDSGFGIRDPGFRFYGES